MSVEKPVWFLDVDGVLNAITRKPDPSVWKDWTHGEASAQGVSWPIWFSPSVTSTITSLVESGRVEVQWLTTWGHAANEDLATLLSLPTLPVLATPPETISAPSTSSPAAHAHAAGAAAHDALTGQWWKFDAVREYLEESPRPVIWTDDDLAWEPACAAWMQAHTSSLLIAPQAALGLTPKHLRRIEDFLS